MKKLYTLSVIYLLLPYLIFLLTWLKPEIGILFFTITVIGLIFNHNIYVKNIMTDKIKFDTKDQIYILLISAFLCFFTGVEGTIPQVGDYWAHNSKLYTLYSYKWPIILPEVNTFLCYYWGTFLVPALLSKFSNEFLPLYSTLWTFIGCYLCIFWFYINLNKRGYLLIVFLCLGGLSGYVIYFFGDPETNFLFGILLNANYLQLLIVPNQFIPTFLIAGIFIYVVANKGGFDIF